jgi:hypothetical protein
MFSGEGVTGLRSVRGTDEHESITHEPRAADLQRLGDRHGTIFTGRPAGAGGVREERP